MLAVLEPLLRRLGGAKTGEDVRQVLKEAASAFGFKSAYLIEYAGALATVKRVIDSDIARQSWWGTYFSSDLRPITADVSRALSDGSVLHLTAQRLETANPNFRKAMEVWDLVDVTAVPVCQNGISHRHSWICRSEQTRSRAGPLADHVCLCGVCATRKGSH